MSYEFSNMNSTAEELEMITSLAGVGYLPKQVAFMLGVSPSTFCKTIKDEDSPESIAYFKGLLSSEYEVRKSIMTLAQSGSSPAQTMAIKIFEGTKQTLIKDEYPGYTDE
jgi:hypothetical protein